jgi:hypothetical protein
MTPEQRMRETIMCPLQRCYPSTKKVTPLRVAWNVGGRFLSTRESLELSMLSQSDRDEMIAIIVARLRGKR